MFLSARAASLFVLCSVKVQGASLQVTVSMFVARKVNIISLTNTVFLNFLDLLSVFAEETIFNFKKIVPANIPEIVVYSGLAAQLVVFVFHCCQRIPREIFIIPFFFR